jgi:methanol--5-hydroxybenzimidazolylcobamide Co-methyltransferase
MNAAAAGPEEARHLRDLCTASDASLDPQAFILRPDVVSALSAEIIAESTPYLRTRRAAQAVLAHLRQAEKAGVLAFSKLEQRWLDRLSRAADSLPTDEDEFIAQVTAGMDASKVRPQKYELDQEGAHSLFSTF